MIFVDSGALVAYSAPDDTHHQRAAAWFYRNRERLFTTDYILDESLTLMRARGDNKRADNLGRTLLSGVGPQLYYLTPEDIAAAWAIFTRFSDKEWSFTDCTSKAVMEKRGITTAFSFDHHFRQFGNIIVVP